MVRVGFVGVALLVSGCQVTIGGGAGANSPDPNAPQNQAAQAQPTQATPPPATPPPATTTGVQATRGISVDQVMGTAANGQQAPVIVGSNDFGSGTPTSGALTGTVYYIPENSQKFPDVSQLKPSGVVYTQQLNIPTRAFNQGFPGIDNRFEWFALRYVGNINVAAAGTYKFRLVSDDGSNLYIDGKKIIDNDGVHSTKEVDGAVQLTPGSHAIQVDYFQGPRDQIALQLFVSSPNMQDAIMNSGTPLR